MIKEPVLVVLEVGVNVMLKLQLARGATVWPQVLD